MNGGMNCHIFDEEIYFIVLYRKEVKCILAFENKTRYEGIGITITELTDRTFVILAPSWLPMKDNIYMLSPGYFKHHSGYSQS